MNLMPGNDGGFCKALKKSLIDLPALSRPHFSSSLLTPIMQAALTNALSCPHFSSSLLTPAGVEEKTRITLAFLKRKEAEFEAIRREIEALKGELASSSGEDNGV